MKKTILVSMTIFAALVSFISCGGSDGDSMDSARTDDNGTNIENNGGSGNEVKTPSEEKTFIDETARLLMSYFKASDFEEMSNASKQLSSVKSGDLDEWAEDILESTLTNSENGYYSNYEYYDGLIKASNIKGKFAATYDGEWEKTGDGSNLVLTYTDKNNAEWILTVTPSGSVKGKLYVKKQKEWTNDYTTRKVTEVYIEVPEQVNVKLTRQGVTQVDAQLNVSSMNVTDGQPTITSTINGTANVTTVGYNVIAVLNYNPNNSSSLSATVKKNDVTLLKVSASGKVFTSDDKLDHATGVTSTIDILGRIQLHLECANTTSLSDAIDKANQNKYDSDIVDQCVADANSAISAAYITNNGGNTKQAELIIGKESTSTYSYNGVRYKLVPLLKFADDTTYSFQEYFTKTAFQDVIDTWNSLVKNFKDLGK